MKILFLWIFFQIFVMPFYHFFVTILSLLFSHFVYVSYCMNCYKYVWKTQNQGKMKYSQFSLKNVPMVWYLPKYIRMAVGNTKKAADGYAGPKIFGRTK